MLRTEVTVLDVGTWVFATARIGVDQVTGKEEYETTVWAPHCEDPKPVRRCLTEQRAREVHQMVVDEFAATAHGRAIVVNC